LVKDHSSEIPDSIVMRAAQLSLGLCQMLIKFSVHGMTHTLGQWQLHAFTLTSATLSIILALKGSSGHFLLSCLP